MDSKKLETKIRIIPLVCVVSILVLRDKTVNSPNPVWMYVVIALGLIAFSSFIYRIYLEKKNGTFVAKRYYLVFSLFIISTLVFVYSLMKM
jgi:Na+/alanine symporter